MFVCSAHLVITAGIQSTIPVRLALLLQPSASKRRPLFAHVVCHPYSSSFDAPLLPALATCLQETPSICMRHLTSMFI
ncbi:putative DNA-polymerase V [Sesbania bispinosa]|nr:putative DNA-polymerase V [Sesbania bispinosa]